ncbi:MAG: CBS domain-containing protein, partial [Nitrosotalea sp.]
DEYFARDIMKEQVVTVDFAATVMDAAKKMDEKNIGCVIVMEKEMPIGILTERDFVKKIAVNEKPMSTPVRNVMSSPLISIDPDATVWELAELMKLKRIHKVPVVQENKLLGIVTTADITSLCSIGSDSEMRKVCQQILLRLHQS